MILGPEGQREYSGRVANTTNNRMEIQALIEGLSRIPKHNSAVIWSDSQYALKSVWQWTRPKPDRKNTDLIEQARKLSQTRSIRWEWVRGHNGHPMNERADHLANTACGAPEGKPAHNIQAWRNAYSPESRPEPTRLKSWTVHDLANAAGR